MTTDFPDIRVVAVSFDEESQELTVTDEGVGTYEALGMLAVAFLQRMSEVVDVYPVTAELEDDDE